MPRHRLLLNWIVDIHRFAAPPNHDWLFLDFDCAHCIELENNRQKRRQRRTTTKTTTNKEQKKVTRDYYSSYRRIVHCRTRTLAGSWMLAESVLWWCEYEKAERPYPNTHCFDVQVGFGFFPIDDDHTALHLAICWLVRPYSTRWSPIQKISCARIIKRPKKKCLSYIISHSLNIVN